MCSFKHICIPSNNSQMYWGCKHPKCHRGGCKKECLHEEVEVNLKFVRMLCWALPTALLMELWWVPLVDFGSSQQHRSPHFLFSWAKNVSNISLKHTYCTLSIRNLTLKWLVYSVGRRWGYDSLFTAVVFIRVYSIWTISYQDFF